MAPLTLIFRDPDNPLTLDSMVTAIDSQRGQQGVKTVELPEATPSGARMFLRNPGEGPSRELLTVLDYTLAGDTLTFVNPVSARAHLVIVDGQNALWRVYDFVNGDVTP